MKKHFIFDFDDTISSSYEHNQNLFVETFLPYIEDKDFDDSVLRKIHKQNRGAGMKMQFQMGIEALDLDLKPEKLVKENEQIHVDKFKKITIFRSVHDLFTKIKDLGKKISICTNRQYTSLNAMIDYHDLRKYFTYIVSCKDEGHEKPDPHCLLDIVKKEGNDLEDFIFFGDSKTDYEFATNAKIDFIIVDHYLNEKGFYDMIIKSFL